MKEIGLNILISCLVITTSWISAAPIQEQKTYKYEYSQLTVEEQSSYPLKTEDIENSVSNDILSQLQNILDNFKSQSQLRSRSDNKKPVISNADVEDNDTLLPSPMPTSLPKISRAIFGSMNNDSSLQETEGGSMCRKNWTAPWQVGLLIVSSDKNEQRCGGVLIHKRWVLTAAHCVENASSVIALVGSSKFFRFEGNSFNGQVIHTKKNYIVHEDYKPSSDSQPPHHDIALVELQSDAKLGPDVEAARLPKRNTSLMKPGTEMIISGWGLTENSALSPNDLHCAQLPIVSRDECEIAYKKQGVKIRNGHVCAGIFSGGVGGCNGDSGGGLIHRGNEGRNTVIGLISWTLKCGDRYTVCTDVRKHKPWILSKIEVLDKN